MTHDPARRMFLLGAGAAGVSSLLPQARASVPPAVQGVLRGACTAMATQAEGPYWADLGLIRRDITDGLPGLPATLYLQVVAGRACTPVQDAAVDVWHADVDGRYSGFAREGTAGLTFMRGIQLTNAAGVARFETVFPGWYPGRTTHIHVKVAMPGAAVFTSQLYFGMPVSSWVYGNDPTYTGRGLQDTPNGADLGFRPQNVVGARRGPGASALLGKRIALP